MAHDPPVPLLPGQCRSARESLGWSSRGLARRAGLVTATVERFEVGAARTRPGTILALRWALEPAGPVFRGDTGIEPAAGTTAGESIPPGAERRPS